MTVIMARAIPVEAEHGVAIDAAGRFAAIRLDGHVYDLQAWRFGREHALDLPFEVQT